jgi:ribonuclease HII
VSVVGIDEVGRGALAGPLVVGAVILKLPIKGIGDSKKLSKQQRSKLAQIIVCEADEYSLGWVSSKEIDKLGLTKAIRLAIFRALKQIGTFNANSTIQQIIIDGNYNFLADDKRSKTIVKADESINCVSAASILAKVARDEWMVKVAAKRYPKYLFERHVGYGTKLHLDAIRQYGPCDIHRLSFRPIKQ